MIRNGDILIFKAGDNIISKCIAILTDSDVSHSAMIHHDMYAVEVGGKGIGINHYVEDAKGETVHVLRLNPEKEPEPLIRAADVYVEAKVKYNYPSLLILAGLLLYREIKPTTKMNEIVFRILKLACLGLNDLINQMIHGKEQIVMMCSQLVYQCYLDCGKEYYIEIEDGLLQNNSGFIRLIDLIEGDIVEEVDLLGTYVEIKEEDIEKLAEELYEALNEAENYEDDLLLSGGDLIEAASMGKKFLELFEQATPPELLQSVPMKALFVTPADLFLHSKNLKEVGEMKISRREG